MTLLRPQLYPNKTPDLSTIDLKHYYASVKLDGIRAMVQGGKLMSRSLKELPNERLQLKFRDLHYLGAMLDGEIYEAGATFQSITSRVMSHDKDVGDLKFYLFDIMGTDLPFEQRQQKCRQLAQKLPNLIVYVEQTLNPNVDEMFEKALDQGFEGIMLCHRDGKYKNGRLTVKQATGFKLKPYQTFDSKIIGVIEQTQIKPGVARTTNELGRSETSKKKGDRELAGTASAFLVTYKNTTVKVSLASMTHEQRKEVWEGREELIGKMVEYRGMLVGAKDVPRHPIFERMRVDRNES